MRYVYVVKKRQIMKTIKKILHNSDFSEKSIEHYLVERVKAMGGECLKYFNPNMAGYPDRIVLLPIGVTLWVELKSKGERLRPLQQQRFNQLARMGQKAYVCDSREDIDRVLEPYKLKRP